MMLANGDPLKTPLCDFKNTSYIPYIEETLWQLAPGASGERLVCLKLEGQDLLVYKSVFYAPPALLPPPAKPASLMARDPQKEKKLLPQALIVFKKITGRAPKTENSLDQKIMTSLIYDIKYPRDLAKEKIALNKFSKIFKRLPKSPLDWSAVRVLAYVL